MMKDVLVLVCAVKHLAHDVHYRSNDEWFYALHLLADKVDFGSAEDDLKEAFYLGQKEDLPPTDAEIEKEAIEKYGSFAKDGNIALIRGLYKVCTDLVYAIEDVKVAVNPIAGVHAILDGISQVAVTIKGLCWRTLDGNTSVIA